jgi:hypothetical protein
MFKKLLAAVGVLTLTAGLVALVSAPAEAHTPTITASCQAGLSVHLVDYSDFATEPNTIKVVVDGVTKTDGPFGGSFDQTYPFAGGQESYTYQILVHAADNQQYTFDTGVVSVTDCATAISPAAASKTDAACVSAGTVGGGGYTIPSAQTGVLYERLDSVSTEWVAIGEGTYPASVGSVVAIRAVAASGYKLTGTTAWTFQIGAPAAADCVVPATPTAAYSVCTATPGSATAASYTVPTSSTGYTFSKPEGTVIVTTFPMAVTVTATAAAGYIFPVGTTASWTFTFTSPGDCLGDSVAVAPIFTPTVCSATPGLSTDNTYTIFPTTGAHFQVKFGTGAFVDVLPGTYSAGSDASSILIQALPDLHFQLSGQTTFSHDFAAAGSCIQDAKWVEPVATSESCVLDGSADGGLGQLGGSVSSHHLTPSFITIPATTGVKYSIDGVVHAAGDVVLAAGTYTVTAEALTGYQLAADYPVGGWREVLVSAAPCGDLPTHPLVDPSVTQVQLQCFSGGSYTLSNDLNDPAAITWTVNGSTVAQGTYKVAAAGTVTVHAAANGPTYGLEQGATQDWTLTFSAPANCDLKTLALTGSAPIGWIVLGYLMLISGLVLVAIRHARRRPTQG